MSATTLERWKPVLVRWASQPEHLRRVAEADEHVRGALARARRPYVAFSGGKDSTALLHLVLQQAPDITVWHWDYGRQFIPGWLEREMVENARRLGAVNLVVEATRRTDKYLGLGEMFGRIAEVLAGYDLVFVGLRAEESLKRRRRTARKASLTAIQECWPLQNWTWRDVWAYIFAHGLRYPSVYERYVPVVGIEQARLCTFFDPEFRHLGTSNVDGLLMWRDRHGAEKEKSQGQ